MPGPDNHYVRRDGFSLEQRIVARLRFAAASSRTLARELGVTRMAVYKATGRLAAKGAIVPIGTTWQRLWLAAIPVLEDRRGAVESSKAALRRYFPAKLAPTNLDAGTDVAVRSAPTISRPAG